MKEFKEYNKTLGFFEDYHYTTKFKGVKKIRNDIVIKGLVIGILLLFIGLSSISTNANVVENNNKPIGNELNNDYTNFLDTIYINLGRFSTGIGFEQPEITDYTYPVLDSNYTLNFTVELNVTSDQKMLLSRGVFTSAKIRIGDSPIWNAYGINFIRGEYVGAWTIKDIERNYNEPPINGQEAVTLSVILKARGFPFGFLKPEEISFTITAHFVEQ